MVRQLFEYYYSIVCVFHSDLKYCSNNYYILEYYWHFFSVPLMHLCILILVLHYFKLLWLYIHLSTWQNKNCHVFLQMNISTNKIQFWLYWHYSSILFGGIIYLFTVLNPLFQKHGVSLHSSSFSFFSCSFSYMWLLFFLWFSYSYSCWFILYS